MIIVLKAVVAFKIARIFELAPKLAYENKVKGITLFEILITNACFHIGFNNGKYFFLNKIGRKIKEAMINLELTNAIGPKSGVPILINIKALPQRAPKQVNKNQYLNSIADNKKPPNKFGGYKKI
jgi:hypothetical protein